MKISVIALAIIYTKSFASLDLSILRKNNSWVYERSHFSGPLGQRIEFEGITRIEIISIFDSPDTLFLEIARRDSGVFSTEPAPQVKERRIKYFIVNDSLKIVPDPTSEGQENANFYSTWGMQLNSQLHYVFYDGTYRYLNKWGEFNGFSGIYLQSVGLIRANYAFVAGMTREYQSINLIDHNDEVFDISKVRIIGDVTGLTQRKKSAGKKEFRKGYKYDISTFEINGRIKKGFKK